MVKRYGLIGFPLSHSFSKKYYSEKFLAEGIENAVYDLFETPTADGLLRVVSENSDLYGVNVTIPHKVEVMRFLDGISEEAREINAVNCITVGRDLSGQVTELIGYNTDVHGFSMSLAPLLKPQHKAALVLGTGGASKAVTYALQKMDIPYLVVSRTSGGGDITYEQIDGELLKNHLLLINTTPLGTFPAVETCPEIPYEYLSDQHLLYDLVYNPAETLFLRKGRLAGAATKNGQEMLVLQAEKNWEIWNA